MSNLVFGGLLLALLAQQPQFRGGVELVTVDVRVLDKDGDPLLGLAAGAFTLKVDGKDRPIKSVQLLRVITTRDAPSGPDAPNPPRRPGIAAGGRALILAFDHEHIRPNNERIAVEGAKKALDAMDPGDRVALVTLPSGRIEVNLTSDREAVRKALDFVVGRATDLPYGVQPTAGVCTLPVLRDLFEGLRGIAGPKTLILISEGFSCEFRNSRMDYRIEFEDLARAANASRVQVFVLQPNSSMIIDANRRLPAGVRDGEAARHDSELKTLEDIAGVTGGDLLRLSGTADAAYARVLRETAAYYELTFEPVESDRNGKPHAISVKVDRPKTTVRARESFLLPK